MRREVSELVASGGRRKRWKRLGGSWVRRKGRWDVEGGKDPRRKKRRRRSCWRLKDHGGSLEIGW